MRAGLQPVTPQNRRPRVGAARDDIRTAYRLLERLHGAGARTARGQFFGPVQAAGRDSNLCEIAHARKHFEMRFALDTRAQDRQHARVFARQRASGHRSRTAGADCRDVGAVHESNRGAGGFVEQHDQGLV